MFPTPTRMFLTKGVGVHRHALTAFEFALRDADIEQQNLVYARPFCRRAARSSAARPGPTYSSQATSRSASWRARRRTNSGGMSTPASEQHGYGMTAGAAGEQAEDLAATMLASTLGLDFDPDAAWNERKQIYEHSHLIIDSTSITATAECGPDNHWTCVVAAAVFLFS
jgi:arginine decarboxylase